MSKERLHKRDDLDHHQSDIKDRLYDNEEVGLWPVMELGT